MEDVIQPASDLFEQTRLEGDACDAWSEKQWDARRGDFISITTGVSYGGGQEVCTISFLFFLFELMFTALSIKRPGNLQPEKVCQVPYVGRLLRSKPIQRMAGFANCRCC